MDAEPQLLNAQIQRDSAEGVDIFSHAVFKVGGATAAVTVGFNTDANYYAVCGETGSIYARAALAGRWTAQGCGVAQVPFAPAGLQL